MQWLLKSLKFMDLATRFKHNPHPLFQQAGSLCAPANDKRRPEYLIISCLDLRVSPLDLFELQAYETIILQSAGPIIPVYDKACSASQLFQENLQIAISDIQVSHLSLIGQAHCSTARKLSQNIYNSGDVPWLKKISDKIMQNAMLNASDDHSLIDEIGRQIILQGIKNLFDYPAIEKAIQNGQLTVEGLQLNYQNGTLARLNTNGNQFTFDLIHRKMQAEPDAKKIPV